MNRTIATIGIILLGIGLFGCVAAFVLWCAWGLWVYVMAHVWPTGPVGIIHPGYLVFVAAWGLLGMIGSAFFRKNNGDGQ